MFCFNIQHLGQSLNVVQQPSHDRKDIYRTSNVHWTIPGNLIKTTGIGRYNQNRPSTKSIWQNLKSKRKITETSLYRTYKMAKIHNGENTKWKKDNTQSMPNTKYRIYIKHKI